MFKFVQRKTAILLIVSVFLVFIEATIAILASDFIQALTALAQNPQLKPDDKSLENLSWMVVQLAQLGLVNVSLIFGGLILFSLIVGVVGVVFSSKAVAMYIAHMRYLTYSKIQTFNFEDIDKFSTPSLITRTTTDAELISISFSFAIKFFPNGLFTLVFGLIKSIIDFGMLSVVYAVILPFLILFIMVAVRKAVPYFKQSQKNTDGVNKNVRESILGIRVVKSYNLEDQEKAKFETTNENLAQSSRKAFTITGILIPIIQSTINATVIVVLIIVFNNAKLNGKPEEFIKLGGFTSILMQVLFGFIIIIATFVQVARAIPSLRRVLEVYKFQSKQVFKNDSTQVITEGKIEFQDVSFSFAEGLDHAVLKNVNLTINPRERIGIIGATGSGKSTFINLISRLLDPTAGKVLIDDIDVKEFSFNQLNANVAIAMQSATLFSGTIKSNIAMGLPLDLSEEQLNQEVKEAAKAAEAWEFILKKENELNATVEQRGKNFSGGQKQRISIARTIAKKSKIVIFDDSTSALDTITERKVQENIRNYNDATTIIVAQRISSVEELDKIIVLDKGQVVGFDHHWNLLKDNDVYRSIAASQLGTEELNEMLIAKGVSPIEKNSN